MNATAVPMPAPAPASVLLPHTLASVRAARETLTGDLAARGIPAEAVDDAVLVVSEILSNALKHARPLESGQLQVSWVVGSGAIEIRVTDGGSSQQPNIQAPSLSSLGGRGLSIVDSLCSDWGVRQDADGNTVWACVPAGAGGSAA